jgi:hypothetical protein
MKTCAVKYSFTFGPERLPTHNFISSLIKVIFGCEDMHMSTVSKYDFDGKPCKGFVMLVRAQINLGSHFLFFRLVQEFLKVSHSSGERTFSTDSHSNRRDFAKCYEVLLLRDNLNIIIVCVRLAFEM